jgi:enoyl-CoA hydratase
VSEPVVIEERDGAILRLVVNRPKQLNAMNADVLAGLERPLRAAANDRTIRAILIKGAGEKAFVAGADIAEMANLGPREAEAVSHRTRATYHAIEACPQPVVAGIDGLCLGGGLELAIACDLRIASDRSRFGLPEVTLGVLPGGGGTARLARLVGVAVAKRLSLTGEIVDASTALRMNLIDATHLAADFSNALSQRMAKFAEMSPAALGRIKSLFNRIIWDGAEAAHELEKLSFAQCFATADQREGMSAFTAKRPAQFTGD